MIMGDERMVMVGVIPHQTDRVAMLRRTASSDCTDRILLALVGQTWYTNSLPSENSTNQRILCTCTRDLQANGRVTDHLTC